IKGEIYRNVGCSGCSRHPHSMGSSHIGSFRTEAEGLHHRGFRLPSILAAMALKLTPTSKIVSPGGSGDLDDYVWCEQRCLNPRGTVNTFLRSYDIRLRSYDIRASTYGLAPRGK